MEGVQLLLRAEQVRLAVSTIAGQYRCFSSWMLNLICQLEYDSVAGGQDKPPAATHTSTQDNKTFLTTQFHLDVIGPEFKVGLPHTFDHHSSVCHHTHTPDTLMPFLTMVQESLLGERCGERCFCTMVCGCTYWLVLLSQWQHRLW